MSFQWQRDVQQPNTWAAFFPFCGSFAHTTFNAIYYSLEIIQPRRGAVDDQSLLQILRESVWAMSEDLGLFENSLGYL